MVRNYSEHLMLEWVLGFDLMTRRPTFAPLNCVVAPYSPESGLSLFYTSTNGLASGNTRTEAVCHALCEVIERDATSLAMARDDVRSAVAAILTSIGFDATLPAESAPPISLRGLPRRAAALVSKLQRAGLEVQLQNLTSAIGIPTIGCTIVDPQGPALFNTHAGCGTHPDARIALTRALTEAAQSRLTGIQGGREDLPDFVPPAGAPPVETRHGGVAPINFDDIASYQHPSVTDDVEFIIERMRQSGFEQIVAVDITRADVAIPVVRVIVPRAEVWTLYLAHGDRASLGLRALQQIR
jgi:ribosomal protein S12 methylthiotransferase accessory factor